MIETEECLELSIKNVVLIKLLYDILKIALDEDSIKELETIKKGMEIY